MLTMTPETQIRSSSSSSFLQEALRTTDLAVYKNTLALKILFNSQKQANGVSVQTASFNYTVAARKEVILSAGAFQSPQLLMLSGVGRASELQKHGIEVLADLPGVGQ